MFVRLRFEGKLFSFPRLRFGLVACLVVCMVGAFPRHVRGNEPAREPAPALRQAPPVATRLAGLNHHRLDEMDHRLRSIFGPRVVAVETESAGWSSYGILVAEPGQRATTLRIGLNRAENCFVVEGPPAATDDMLRLVRRLDGAPSSGAETTRAISLWQAEMPTVREAIDAYLGKAAPTSRRPTVAPVAYRTTKQRSPTQMAQLIFRRRNNQQVEAVQESDVVVDVAPGDEQTALEVEERRLRQLRSEVEIETLPELDVLILRGSQRNVDELLRIIEEIERISAERKPEIVVLPLDHAASDTLADVIQSIEGELLAGQQGRATVTPLVKPNALLIIGWGEALRAVVELAEKLDHPVAPDTQFRVFRLRFAPAANVQATLDDFFANREGLGPKVLAIADVRSNSVVVQAGPRDMAEAELLIRRLDTDQSAAVNQLRVFHLRNSLADDLAPVLEAALRGEPPAPGEKAFSLELLTIDAEGGRLLKSGLLDGVRVTPDPRTNTLLVSAPVSAMELIGALVEQLDGVPAAVAQIKVFRIVNGDASDLVQMLRALLGAVDTAPPPQLAGAEGEPSLAPLRFAVDVRTNSIIASGSAGDLNIVEAILLRLDESDIRERRSTVYRLRNAPALDVAQSLNQFLRSERQVLVATPGTLSPFQQMEQEVVVVPEPISNALIISATERFYDHILELVEELDAQPPQVLIQVLIAEVDLRNTDEFGVELGLQDSVLFNRSLLGDLLTTTTSTTFGDPPTTVQTQTVQAASLTPGFNFNNVPLGNSGSDASLATRKNLAGQALSSFSVGRVNTELGFGGLVLSASNDSISVLIRALSESRRLHVLARPQVMTLDNQSAFIQVGQRVPRVTATQATITGLVTSVVLDDVGLILGVTPRISPDGMVVMEVDAERSEVGTDAEGIPISVLPDGEVLRSPRINTTTAQTTVSATSGQTIVLGGLITKRTANIHRRVPYLADIPILGHLFRYDASDMRRTELLIILTPHVVRSKEEAELLKQVESARIHWCLADVHAMHGDAGLCKAGDCEHCDAAAPTVYPDFDPRGMQPLHQYEHVHPAVPHEAPEQPVMPQPGDIRLPRPDGPIEMPQGPATPGLTDPRYGQYPPQPGSDHWPVAPSGPAAVPTRLPQDTAQHPAAPSGYPAPRH